MGAGDAKLAGALGLALGFLGWGYVLVGFVVPLFVQAGVGVALLVLGKVDRKSPVPYGPALVGGTVLAIPITGLLG